MCQLCLLALYVSSVTPRSASPRCLLPATLDVDGTDALDGHQDAGTTLLRRTGKVVHKRGAGAQ